MEISAQPWPKAAQTFLDDLYAKFGSVKDEQKIHVLKCALGQEDMGTFYSAEVTVEQMRVMIEQELLHSEGLIELELC